MDGPKGKIGVFDTVSNGEAAVNYLVANCEYCRGLL